jgi:hypothetical protein
VLRWGWPGRKDDALSGTARVGSWPPIPMTKRPALNSISGAGTIMAGRSHASTLGQPRALFIGPSEMTCA